METGVYKDYVECLLCGYKGTTLSGHLRYHHKVTAKEYKDSFGLCRNQPLESEALTERRREAVRENPHVIKNLLVDGKDTRFKDGGEGNTHMSEQRLAIIRENVKKTPNFKKKKG